MLVLSRKRNQAVVIPLNHAHLTELMAMAKASPSGDVRFKIIMIEAAGDKVRLGFEVPRPIPVHREDVMLRIDEEKRNAG